jgi:glycosyltransferase involved in cell wall biosynthesis
VQLILVNDGSPDGCGAICEAYKEKYPENVVYIEQENRGVSAARNVGLDVASGEFVAFLDGDDRYGGDYLTKFVEALSVDPISVCTAGIFENFGFKSGEEERFSLSRYKKNRIIQSSDNVTHALYLGYVGQLLFRASALTTIRFNENLISCSEVDDDIDFIGRVIGAKKFLFLQDCKYFKRNSFAEYTTSEKAEIEQYKFERITQIYKPLYESMLGKWGFVPFFIQQTVLEHIHEMFLYGSKSKTPYADNSLLFSPVEFILQNTDVSIINCKLFLSRVKKHFTILKFGQSKLVQSDERSVFQLSRFDLKNEPNEPVIVERLGENPLVVHIISEKQGILLLRVSMNYVSYESHSLAIISGFQTEIREVSIPNERNKLYFNDIQILPTKYYEIEINLNSHTDEEFARLGFISFYYLTSLGTYIPATLQFVPHSGMGYNMPFTLGDEYIVKTTGRTNTISALPLTAEEFNNTCAYIRPYSGLGEPSPESVEKFELLKNSILYNFKILSQRRIWLFIDRGYDIGNNAEALFRYCVTQNDGIEKYYVIPSEDFRDRFAGLPCVVIGSDEYKLFCVFAEKFISSYLFGGGLTYNYGVERSDKELWEDTQNFKKLTRCFFRGDIIHVQHGVIMQDISYYLVKFEENIRVLLSTCQKEYDYIKNELSRAIDPNVLRLTGLPRLDDLERVKNNPKSEKIILFAPSFDWNYFQETKYIPEYKYSAHYKYLQSILSSCELLDLLETNGYKLYFKPHYLVIPMLCDFKMDSRVKVITNEINRYDLYAMCDLMISDYSGIAWDFAYLKKPVVYTHFTEPKYDEVYFSYENDGFGEICRTIEDLVGTLREYIVNGCQMSDKYLSRVDSFYSIQDGHNCERIYNELISLGDTRKNIFRTAYSGVSV